MSARVPVVLVYRVLFTSSQWYAVSSVLIGQAIFIALTGAEITILSQAAAGLFALGLGVLTKILAILWRPPSGAIGRFPGNLPS